MGSGYSIAQLLLKEGDGFCVVRYSTGEEEVVNMQDTKPLVSLASEPMVSMLLPCKSEVTHEQDAPFWMQDHLVHGPFTPVNTTLSSVGLCCVSRCTLLSLPI